MKLFSEWVRKTRRGAEITLRDLSEASGLSEGFISEFERSGRDGITIDNARRIANALGTTLGAVLKELENDDKP